MALEERTPLHGIAQMALSSTGRFAVHAAMRAKPSAKQSQWSFRRLGLPWMSAVDDLMSVRKALAAGLFANAAQYISTTVESRDKEHTGVDLYQLVRSTGHGQPSC